VFLVFLVLGIASNNEAFQGGYTEFDDPIKFIQGSVDPLPIILKASGKKGWTIKEQKNDFVTVALEDYRHHFVRIKINYTKSEISFEEIEAYNTKCGYSKKNLRKLKKCDPALYDYRRWRVYLRKTIARFVQLQLLENIKQNIKGMRELKQNTAAILNG